MVMLVRLGSGESKVIVFVMLFVVQNVISPPPASFAWVIAARSEPSPLSFVFETQIGLAANALAARAHSAMTSPYWLNVIVFKILL